MNTEELVKDINDRLVAIEAEKGRRLTSHGIKPKGAANE